MKLISPTSRDELYIWSLLSAFLYLCLLISCSLPGDAAPVVKIGLIAPFEGLGRPLGYTVLPIVQEAIGHSNHGGRFGRYRVGLVALDDSLDPQTAAVQARALVQDPDILAVLGPWTAGTATAAVPVLSQAGIPILAVAPLPGRGSYIFSLCPDELSVQQALFARAESLANGAVSVSEPGAPVPKAEVAVYLGDAAAAAEDLQRWRAEGWVGQLVGGPDLFRPWFIQRAGEAGEGTLALACGQASDQNIENVTTVLTARLAEVGIEALLQALAAEIIVRGRPGREGIAKALTGMPVTSAPEWYQVQGGHWQRR